MSRQHPDPPVALILNAGGQSRRMGQPKALLPVPGSGQPLALHIVRRLRPLAAGGLVVVTNQAEIARLFPPEEGVQVLGDAYPGGALGGLATGLGACDGWAMAVACDMPLVSREIFAWLIQLVSRELDEGGAERWDAVVPLVAGYPQSFHALYHRRCLPAIEATLRRGERRVASFLADVRTRYVTEEEIRPLDPALRSFLNVNTPEEWAEVRPFLT